MPTLLGIFGFLRFFASDVGGSRPKEQRTWIMLIAK